MEHFQVKNIRLCFQGYYGFEAQQSKIMSIEILLLLCPFKDLPEDLLNVQNVHENTSERIP